MYFTKDDFFRKFGDRLAKVNPPEDVETGEYQLFSPEENHIASEWLQKGYDVASVYETSEGDLIKIDNDCGSNPYKIGFIVLHRHPKTKS